MFVKRNVKCVQKELKQMFVYFNLWYFSKSIGVSIAWQ